MVDHLHPGTRRISAVERTSAIAMRSRRREKRYLMVLKESVPGVNILRAVQKEAYVVECASGHRMFSTVQRQIVVSRRKIDIVSIRAPSCSPGKYRPEAGSSKNVN